jgi:DNA recombination protein RmuC
MMQALIGGIALIAGVLVGFWLKVVSGKAEKTQLERRGQELTAELIGVRAELAKAQAESGARAGFESLATEREKVIAQLAAERDGLRADLQAKGAVESAQNARVKELETELRNERQNLAEKLALLDSAKQALANQFEALAADILEKKSKSFSEGSQKELGTLLTPLKEQIKEFREKVEKAQSDSNTGVTKLETLIGTLGGLNQQLSEEAHNLTTALRGSSRDQGDWGQKIACDLLELGGLREGVNYRSQQTFDATVGDDTGRQRNVRPDIVVNLPGGRNLIIDSKVSLNAYYQYVKAESDADRKSAIKSHLASVRRHIDELAAKSYHKLQAIESPDFVVMFIPIEPAFLVAIHEDGDLWHYAYEKQILLVGPTTLLFVIRIVDNLWRQELQSRSVDAVMDRGIKLYEKFVGFIADIEAIGKSLRGANQSYEDAKGKLTGGPGNLIRQVEMLKQLGIRTGKSIPRHLLDIAGVEEPGFALAAEAEESGDAE